AQNKFLVTGLKSGEVSTSRQVALGNVGVEILKKLSESVGITLSMPAGIHRIATGLGTHQRWILHHVLVGLVAVSYPHRVGRFGMPGERSFRTIHLKPQTRAAPSAHLRNGHHSAKSALKMQQDGRIIVRSHLYFVEGPTT